MPRLTCSKLVGSCEVKFSRGGKGKYYVITVKGFALKADQIIERCPFDVQKRDVSSMKSRITKLSASTLLIDTVRHIEITVH